MKREYCATPRGSGPSRRCISTISGCAWSVWSGLGQFSSKNAASPGALRGAGPALRPIGQTGPCYMGQGQTGPCICST
eukprot:scaffold20895_cov57-Phaeocystis_antarctica.AAC.1